MSVAENFADKPSTIPRSQIPRLHIRGVSKSFGAFAVLRALDLALAPGERMALLGQSGAGKTTLLRLIAGLDGCDAGEIAIDGRTVSRAGVVEAPETRNVGMVFPTLGLWPHLSAAAHLDLVLKKSMPDKSARHAEAVRLLALARIADKAGSRPGELSSGQQQRLAIVRALAPRPAVLLLDEPFANLDTPLRDAVAEDAFEMFSVFNPTVLLVSHDAAHAASLCARMGIMESGRIVQTGTPREIYERPATRASAELTGPAFLVEGTAQGREAETRLGRIELTTSEVGGAPGLVGAAGAGGVCVRPEGIRILPEGQGAEGAGMSAEGPGVSAEVVGSEFVNGRYRVRMRLGDLRLWCWSDVRLDSGRVGIRVDACAWIADGGRIAPAGA